MNIQDLLQLVPPSEQVQGPLVFWGEAMDKSNSGWSCQVCSSRPEQQYWTGDKMINDWAKEMKLVLGCLLECKRPGFDSWLDPIFFQLIICVDDKMK